MTLALVLGVLAGAGLLLLGWASPGGAAAAAGLGAFAILRGGLLPAALLFGFVAASNLLGRRERRNAAQVLANGLAPVLGLLLGPAAFLGGLAAATADTLASEIGARAPVAWRPDRGRVPPGTNAAVSPRGTLALLLAAAAVAVFAPWFQTSPGAVLAGGVAGALADTLVGLLLEERVSFWGNDLTNLACTLTGTLVAAALA